MRSVWLIGININSIKGKEIRVKTIELINKVIKIEILNIMIALI